MSRTISPTPETRRKAKKSYTLSPESVAFLENLRKKRHAASTSLVLDEILQTALREQETRDMENAVAEYYDSLSESERAEQSEWGKFALAEFPAGQQK
jgi:hypothetical protein